MTGPDPTPLGPTTDPGAAPSCPTPNRAAGCRVSVSTGRWRLVGKWAFQAFWSCFSSGAQEAAQGSLGSLTPQPGQEQSSWLDPHLDKAS